MHRSILKAASVALAVVVASTAAEPAARVARAEAALQHTIFVPFAIRDHFATGQVTFAVIGSYGACGSGDARACAAERAVADLVRSWRPDFVITTGGNRVQADAGESYDASVRAVYGEYMDKRFFPAMGSEDWLDIDGKPSADAYLHAFPWLAEHTRSLREPPEPANGSRGRYYHFQAGTYTMPLGGSCPLVHLFAIDSTAAEPDGRAMASRQGAWLAGEMAGSPACMKMAYFHHPPYSSGSRLGTEADRTAMRAMRDWDWQGLGIKLLHAGRSRNFEALVLNRWPVLIVNGLGGAGQDPWAWIDPFSAARFPDAPDGLSYGASLVTATVAPGGVAGLTSTAWMVDVTRPDQPARLIHALGFSGWCGCVR